MTLPAANPLVSAPEARPAFLTPDELRDLTGYARPSAQETWLRARGFNVAKNGAGRVMLTWDAVIQWQLGGAARQLAAAPNWGNIK